jgi:Tol biopolymer transport system component
MTAKTDRSFDEAFIGVYGGAPAQLYGRFVAELTADALTFERTLSRDAFMTGTLVQKLQRNTGDPAVSPDGRYVALVLRRQDRPSELVVWRTANEPDTLAARRRKQQLERDPEDVPDRSFYPAPKRVVISLVAADGAPYETPRWLSDNRRLLLTRRMPMSDGTIRPDLFLWSAEDGSLSRLTSGAGIRDADPSHDGSWAAAVRCDQGWCDLVRVELATGAVRVLLTGSVTRNYYRPRVSKRTGEIVVAEQSGDRWRIVRVNPATSELRYADPDDGVTRYDATYDVDGRTIIATSEAGGIPNVERLDSARTSPIRLSAVTGAAVGADVAPDGAIWFLSLTASGYDLRRLTPDSTSIARTARLPLPLRSLFVDSLSPVLPPQRTIAVDSTRRPARGAVGPERAYEFGPSRFRYLPGISSGFGGTSAQLALVRSDPVGRLGIALIGSAGSGALPAGGALEIASRRARNVLVANAWASHEAPSRILPENFSDGFDLTRFGGALRLERATATDGGDILATIGALGERQLPSALSYVTRSAAFAALNVVRRQSDEDTRYVEQLYSMGEVGKSGDGNYQRQRTTLFFGVGTAGRPLTTARVSYGTMGGSDSLSRERFAIGGIPSPLIEPMLDGRRVDAAAYPVGSALGTSFSAYRLGLPLPPVELFYAAVSPDLFKRVLRSYGAEMRQHLAAVPALGTPDIDLLTGFARAVDAPVKGEWRYYVTVAVKP